MDGGTAKAKACKQVGLMDRRARTLIPLTLSPARPCMYHHYSNICQPRPCPTK